MASPLDRLLAVLRNPAVAEEFAQQPDIWKGIVRAAEVHRLSGVLAHSTLGRLPNSEKPCAARVLMEHHAMHAQQLANLGIIIEAFRKAGIRCVALKGPLLAERVYPQPFLKFSRDLDLLIDESDTGAATHALQALGYSLLDTYPWDVQRKISQHLVFATSHDRRPLELHYSLRSTHFELPMKEFMETAVPWRSGTGFEALVLRPEYEVFYLAVHAAFHAFHRLRWLYDTVAAAKQTNAVQLTHLRELAAQYRLTGYVSAAQIAAREFLGESLDLGCDAITALTPTQIRATVERTTDGVTTNFMQKLLFRMDLCRMTESPADIFRMLADGVAVEAARRRGNRLSPEAVAATLPGY